MDLDKIVSELSSERERLGKVIALLESNSTGHQEIAVTRTGATLGRRTGRVTSNRTPSAGRSRQAAKMKAYWARWRKQHAK